MTSLGQAGSRLSRDGRKSPIWFVGTSGGPLGLSLDCDSFLDVAIVELEDFYHPRAPEWSVRGASFLQSTKHDALPIYVDQWPITGGRSARARMVNGKLGTAAYDGQSLCVATRYEPCVGAWDYLHTHRLPGRGLPPWVAARIVQRVADLLSVAHRRGVEHGAVMMGQLGVRADARPLLQEWCSQRARGSGGSHGDDVWTLRRSLGFDPAATSVQDDIFRLGCVFSTWLTGAAPFVETDNRVRYVAPSSRAAMPAGFDAIVGQACDPARGFASSAAEIADALALLLANARTPPSKAAEALERGDLTSFAEWMACHQNDGSDLARPLRDAGGRVIVDGLLGGGPVPLFSELLVALSEPARSDLVSVAKDRSLGAFERSGAIQLLEQVDHPDAAELSYARVEDHRPISMSQGSGSRPVITRRDGSICPHGWTSLQGEPVIVSVPPRPDDPASLDRSRLERVCPICGPVSVIHHAWYVGHPWTAPPEDSSAIELALDGVGEESVGLSLEIGRPVTCASENAEILVEGLDPAHESVWMNYGAGKLWVVWNRNLGGGGRYVRTSVLDTHADLPDRTLRIGPLTLRVARRGRIALSCDSGAHVALRTR